VPSRELKLQSCFSCGIRQRLSNAQFVDKAPEDVIEAERAREKELETLINNLEHSLSGLKE